jgi:hypothetical protein
MKFLYLPNIINLNHYNLLIKIQPYPIAVTTYLLLCKPITKV